MEKSEIRNYLEKNLKSHPDNVFDSGDRLVLITDVVEIIYDLIEQQKEPFLELLNDPDTEEKANTKNFKKWLYGD
jgi:glycosylphosphatidylinositol transamidase (GPIT) subunit GPI8